MHVDSPGGKFSDELCLFSIFLLNVHHLSLEVTNARKYLQIQVKELCTRLTDLV